MERKALPSLRRSEDTNIGLALPQVEHRELRYFVAVAEELHFTHAAERLEMSQPPLSAAIAHLESKLGTRLFERDSRHVQLTPAGVALLQRARPILRQVDDAVDAARRADGGRATLVRLVTDSVGRASLVPALCLALERAEESLTVEVDERIPAEITEALLSGAADVALVVGSGEWIGLGAELVRSVLPVALFDASHPLAGRKRVRLDELAEHRLALWPEEQAPDTHKLVASLFDGIALQRGTVILPMHSGIWAEELAAGSFCVLPADAPIVSGFVSARISGVTATFDTWLAWSKGAPPPHLEAIRTSAASLNGNGAAAGPERARAR
jgi:DNA-binding transcriptional LysR family regulator